MPKVLILTGDAAESLEVMYPYQRLLDEYDVVHCLSTGQGAVCRVAGGQREVTAGLPGALIGFARSRKISKLIAC